MLRRALIRVVLAGALGQTAPGLAQQVEIVLQVSLTAGLCYHEAKAIWDQMKLGDRLTLIREADNPFDPNAVRVDWNEHKLGYIPRAENAAVARQLDRGNRLSARITRLSQTRNHRRKLEFEVFSNL